MLSLMSFSKMPKQQGSQKSLAVFTHQIYLKLIIYIIQDLNVKFFENLIILNI